MIGRSTREEIFILRQVIENTREFRKQAYMGFVDFKVILDSVDWKSLCLILRTTCQFYTERTNVKMCTSQRET